MPKKNSKAATLLERTTPKGAQKLQNRILRRFKKPNEPDSSVPVDPWVNAGPTASNELVRVGTIGAKVEKVRLDSIGREGSSEDDLLQISLVISNLHD